MVNARRVAKFFAICGLFAVTALSAEPERLPVGEFTAVRFAQPPKIDGLIDAGEWDCAFATEGMMAPFEQELHESVTRMSLGFDSEKLYFLMACRRGNAEWKLWKICRQNDDYNFGEPSVEIWVTPPALVPETYQSVINTYPAVMDAKMIPSRGYTAMGWKGGWQIGVRETDNDYVIEASIPIRDFGVETIKNGDIWHFLLCRTCHGAKPRSQASWSVTQGFAEIAQHVPVHMMDDEAVAQLSGTHTLFTGRYALPIAIVAPRKSGVEVDVEIRFHKTKTPGKEGDKVEKRRMKLAAGERKEEVFSGDISDFFPLDKNGVKRGNVTISAVKSDGAVVFRQSFAFPISGWTPQAPQKSANAPPVEELALTAQYGSETNTVLIKADIFDLPDREQAASAEARVVEENGKVIASAPMRPFREWYAGAEIRLEGADIPVDDFRKVADLRAKIREIKKANEKRKEKGEPAEPLPQVPHPTPKKVKVMVAVKDKDGKEIKTAEKPLDLLRYDAEWMNNSIGITDKVIPPWTPITAQGGEIGVWNRRLSLDGLGLAQSIKNGDVEQLANAMRLVAVKDGQEIEFKAAAPKVVRSTEAEADLTGSAEAAGLKITAGTRVEFDGFVKLDWNISPAGQEAAVDRLYLEIQLPEAEATHFCSTAGGWATIHDALPDHWSSQSTASGMLIGDFVPYIWLTNSDRAFIWFADSDRDWNHEPEKALPTQEIVRQDGKVILRVNFFEIPTEVKKVRRIIWGWQTFPSRPLPKGWRATFCIQRPPVPHTTNTYFWIDADWAVLWPYYCSPFPWDMEKSKSFLDNAKKHGGPNHRPCVGSIAHSIGRYMDYEGNQFPGLAVDWGATPGIIGNADVTASKGPNDFRLWYYQRWVREAGFCGLYVDENYLGLEENTLTGNAYWLPDGRLQRAYNYLGLREYFKRLKVMFHENGVALPNLWQHISSGAAYHAWFGDIFFEGENIQPTDLTFDYFEVLPAGRMRAIGSAVCAGGVMNMMCQSDRHRTTWHEKHTHQFIGWVMAHDILPEQCKLYYKLCEAGHLWDEDVRFLPYWKPSPYKTKTANCLISAHATKDRALLWVVNTGRQDADVMVDVDWQAAGLAVDKTTAKNAETNAPIALAADGFSVAVPQRDFVPILLVREGAGE